MANTIGLAKKYVPLLDEIYQKGAITSIFEADASLVREGLTADTIYIAKTALQGLGDYDRATGYTQGDITFTWEAHQFTQDRGRKFYVDAMDDLESVGLAFGTLVNEFMRTKVAPELDAYRFATLAGKAGTTAEADLTAATVDAAIEAAIVEMDNAEVPAEGRILFVSPQVASLIRQSNNYVRNVSVAGAEGIDNRFDMYNGMRVVVVPQTRFYTAITLYDGTTAGQEAGGYIKTATTGKNINFMIVHPTATFSITKTATPKIITPEQNPDADAYIFGYRLYHDIFVPDNKTKGIYVHNATV